MKVSILKCNDYNIEEIYKVIKQSLTNIDFEIPKNKTILLKPNVLGQRKPETAVDTHPAILDALCILLKENNNELWIGDSGGVTAYGGTKKAFEVSGIADIARNELFHYSRNLAQLTNNHLQLNLPFLQNIFPLSLPRFLSNSTLPNYKFAQII